jgi:hypothetical protein
VHLLETLFKVVQSPPKQFSPEHKQFCDALNPTKKDNPAKIQTFNGRAVWHQPQNLRALSLLCILRNILEHGHAGTNASASAKTAGGALAQQYTRWQLLEELASASLAFLQAIGLLDAEFPPEHEHAHYQGFLANRKEFLAAHEIANSLRSLFCSGDDALPSRDWCLRFTLSAPSRDLGSRMLRTSQLFFGRDLEMQALQQQLAQERCRLVILGGAGYGSLLTLLLSLIFLVLFFEIYFFLFRFCLR